jgi:hypothetical protein
MLVKLLKLDGVNHEEAGILLQKGQGIIMV